MENAHAMEVNKTTLNPTDLHTELCDTNIIFCDEQKKQSYRYFIHFWVNYILMNIEANNQEARNFSGALTMMHIFERLLSRLNWHHLRSNA